MAITRRKFLQAAGALALMGGLLAAAGGDFSRLAIGPAAAETVPVEDLMAAGPLEDRVVGAAEAPVTVVEYASMTCPHCADFHTKVYPELKKRYIETGKARFIFREFPLERRAALGSVLARCAGADNYFAVIDALFRAQDKWAVRNPMKPLFALAKKVGFTEKTFDACIANQDLLTRIEQSRDRAAEKLGVDATPTFFINGTKLVGAESIEEMAAAIDPLLKN